MSTKTLKELANSFLNEENQLGFFYQFIIESKGILLDSSNDKKWNCSKNYGDYYFPLKHEEHIELLLPGINAIITGDDNTSTICIGNIKDIGVSYLKKYLRAKDYAQKKLISVTIEPLDDGYVLSSFKAHTNQLEELEKFLDVVKKMHELYS